MSWRSVRSKKTLMDEWIQVHRYDDRVTQWLVDHPTPFEWEGTAMEYAWLEMPDLETIAGRMLLRLGF